MVHDFIYPVRLTPELDRTGGELRKYSVSRFPLYDLRPLTASLTRKVPIRIVKGQVSTFVRTRAEQYMEHDAVPYSHTAYGSVFLFQYSRVCRCFSSDRAAGRDETYHCKKRRSDDFSVLVDTFGGRNKKLQFHLGNGRGKPDLNRHGFRSHGYLKIVK
jgi:hypothetical protein